MNEAQMVHNVDSWETFFEGERIARHVDTEPV
jgi:hypothetical protein